MSAAIGVPTLEELRWGLAQAATPPVRGMLEFAETELILPTGPYAGRKFRADRLPIAKIWLNEADSGRWRYFVTVKPSQAGGTWLCFIIPTLFHLFELQEGVICGVPDENMAADKWREVLLPAIERSRYAKYLPIRGDGSKGSPRVRAVQFTSGVTLRFMHGSGRDEARAGYSARVLEITEANAFGSPGTASPEAAKYRQLRARTRAYGDQATGYEESTPTTKAGRIWWGYEQESSASFLVLPCPKCHAWVELGREDLVGWQDATNEVEARRLAHFRCNQCQAPWSSEQWRRANQLARLLHKGQQIDRRGKVTGNPPETETFGFRWSAAHNLLTNPGAIGRGEWLSLRAADPDEADREQCQFVWALPTAPLEVEPTPLDREGLTHRQAPHPQGQCPPKTSALTFHVDVGQYVAHWAAIAWRAEGSGHIVDYGAEDVLSPQLGVAPAILAMLRQLDERIRAGWLVADGSTLIPAIATVDAGWQGPQGVDVVYQFCAAAPPPWLASLGFGSDRWRIRRYTRPSKKGATVREIGNSWHVSRLTSPRRLLRLDVDADAWKSRLHEGLSCPIDAPGAITLFAAPPGQHLTFCRHLTSELLVESWTPEKGRQIRWVAKGRKNHWLDCCYNCLATADRLGIRPTSTKAPGSPDKSTAARKTTATHQPGATASPPTRGWWATQRRRGRR